MKTFKAAISNLGRKVEELCPDDNSYKVCYFTDGIREDFSQTDVTSLAIPDDPTTWVSGKEYMVYGDHREEVLAAEEEGGLEAIKSLFKTFEPTFDSEPFED